MNTDELKKLLKGSTAVLILEDGKPSFVILGYDAYKGLLSDQEKEVKINHSGVDRHSAEVNGALSRRDDGTNLNERQPQRGGGQFHERVGEKESELLEKINKQILALKDEIDKEEKSADNPHIDPVRGR